MADAEKVLLEQKEETPKGVSPVAKKVNEPDAKDQTTPPRAVPKKAAAMTKGGLPMGNFEKGFYNNFMNPMLAKMEESVRKNTEALDELNRKLEDEREANRKKRLTKHIPGPLQGHGQNLDDIMKHIENLIVYENFNEEDQNAGKLAPARLRELDDHGSVAILGHSLAAYISTLEPTHLRQFTNRIVSDTALWISRLFRFNDSSAFYHEEDRDGVLRICRLALHRKYSKYAMDGYDALYSRPPVIYISGAAKPALGQYLCTQLGLPLTCLCTVPCMTKMGQQHRMDMTGIEKMIQDDINGGKTPLMVISYAGTPAMGHVDNVQVLAEICKKNEIWLHIEGNNLATLAMFSVPTSIIPAKSGDSMTLNLGAWLGLPSVPYVTLYKASDPTLAHAAGLTTFNSQYKLNCLPLWLCLQNLGHEGVVNKIKHSIDLANALSTEILKFPSLRHVSKKRKPPPKETKSLGDLISRAISALVIFEIENPTVVFRYNEAKEEEKAPVEDGSGDKSKKKEEEEPKDVAEAEENRDPYFDALNIWLCETLRREVPNMYIQGVEIEGEGVSIRFSPLDTAQVFGTQVDDVEDFIHCLKTQMKILNATVRQRAEFQSIVDAQDNLLLVTLTNWAGLGAVQYLPETRLQEIDNLSDEGRVEINSLNTQLVQQLKSADTAFSLGMTDEGLACVRFGLITEETDLEELIGLVYTTGKEVEDSSKFLETMAEIVKQGIEKANVDLQKENENKLVQEGVLRQVPLVSSFINWFSPPPKDTAKGRTFNLASGKVETTEKTYQYHMQVQEATPESSPSSKQGSFKNNLKPTGRRQSDQSSAGSAADVKFYQSTEDSNTVDPEQRDEQPMSISEGTSLLDESSSIVNGPESTASEAPASPESQAEADDLK